MHLFIVTGSSRGLGAALAQQLSAPGHTVIGIARRAHPGLSAEQWTLDLADPLPAAERLQAWLQGHGGWQSATLINNAALLSQPGPLADTATQVALAEQLGISTSAVNQAIHDKYRGNVDRLCARVRGLWAGDTVSCPVLGSISTKVCIDQQAKGVVYSNPMRVALAKD